MFCFLPDENKTSLAFQIDWINTIEPAYLKKKSIPGNLTRTKRGLYITNESTWTNQMTLAVTMVTEKQ